MTLNRSTLITLSEVLAGIDEMDWENDLLYIEGNRTSWTPDSQCVVIEVDPYDEGNSELTINGTTLGYALAGFQVLDLVRNLQQRAPRAFAAAIRHFHEFDGFMPE